MAISVEELRLVAFLMAAAFASMAAVGFYPSWSRRKATKGAVRGERRVPALIEALWVAVQVVIVGAIAGALFAPGLLLSNPFSGLPYTSVHIALAGAAVFCLGAAVAGTAARHLGAQLTVAIETREGAALATSGPYARVRHPIYTGIFLMVAGLAIALAAPVVAAFVAVAVYCGNYRARLEEDLLASDAAFAAEYRLYVARTGRFLPRGRE